jgi:predicted exporter
MKPHTLNKVFSYLFLLVTLFVVASLYLNKNELSTKVESDIFALLPKSERNPHVEKAVLQISKKSENTIILLIKGSTADSSVDVGEYLQTQFGNLPIQKSSSELDFHEVTNFYMSYKNKLVSEGDLDLLKKYDSSDWYQRAMNQAYSLGISILPWKEDPFGTFSNWLADLGKISQIRPYRGNLIIEHLGETYVLLPYEITLQEGSLSEKNNLAINVGQAIDRAVAKFPDAKIYRTGMIFHSAAASRQAENEISTIGLLSSLCAIALIFLAFRRGIVICLVLVTVGIAFLYAFFMTSILFGKVFLLTLVFGTSLIGMSVDYCLYWLTCSIDATESPFARRRKLYPGMLMALFTTSAAYLLLGITPFPVLTQMAVFSISGIAAAWFVVMIFYPLIGNLGLQRNSFVDFFYGIKSKIQKPLVKKKLLVSLLMFGILGLPFIKVDDDIRSLINLDQRLIQDQQVISKVMGLPSPAQFYLVKGESPDLVLKRSEQTTKKLDLLIQGGQLKAYQAISQYLPSQSDQLRAHELFENDEFRKALKKLQVEFHMSDEWSASNSSNFKSMQFSDWIASDIGKKFGFLWFNLEPNMFATAILLKDISGNSGLQELEKLSDENVIWVNKTTEISEVFSRYRVMFSGLLIVGYLLTFLLLFTRYKRDAWRVIAPPIMATMISLGLLSLCGISIGLLTILGMALVLGVGTDYGIFLLEYPLDKRLVFSITMGCLMTVMSFGSLSLSGVPALNSFGLTLFFGVSLSWLFTLLLAKDGNHV